MSSDVLTPEEFTALYTRQPAPKPVPFEEFAQVYERGRQNYIDTVYPTLIQGPVGAIGAQAGRALATTTGSVLGMVGGLQNIGPRLSEPGPLKDVDNQLTRWGDQLKDWAKSGDFASRYDGMTYTGLWKSGNYGDLFGKLIADTAEVGPSLAVSVMAASVGGPAAAGVAGGLLEGSSYYDQLREEGTGKEEALARSGAFGVMVGMLNKIPFDEGPAKVIQKRLGSGKIGVGATHLLQSVAEGLTETAEGSAQVLASQEKFPTSAEDAVDLLVALGDGFYNESGVFAPAMLSRGAMSPGINVNVAEREAAAKTSANQVLMDNPEWIIPLSEAKSASSKDVSEAIGTGRRNLPELLSNKDMRQALKSEADRIVQEQQQPEPETLTPEELQGVRVPVTPKGAPLEAPQQPSVQAETALESIPAPQEGESAPEAVEAPTGPTETPIDLANLSMDELLALNTEMRNQANAASTEDEADRLLDEADRVRDEWVYRKEQEEVARPQPEPVAAPTPQVAQQPQSVPLEDFVNDVNLAAKRAHQKYAPQEDKSTKGLATRTFGPDKVFIRTVYDEFKEMTGLDMPFEEFQQRLIEANREGGVSLSRADLVHVMNPDSVRASETPYLNATFHFIRTPGQVGPQRINATQTEEPPSASILRGKRPTETDADIEAAEQLVKNARERAKEFKAEQEQAEKQPWEMTYAEFERARPEVEGYLYHGSPEGDVADFDPYLHGKAWPEGYGPYVTDSRQKAATYAEGRTAEGERKEQASENGRINYVYPKMAKILDLEAPVDEALWKRAIKDFIKGPLSVNEDIGEIPTISDLGATTNKQAVSGIRNWLGEAMGSKEDAYYTLEDWIRDQGYDATSHIEGKRSGNPHRVWVLKGDRTAEGESNIKGYVTPPREVHKQVIEKALSEGKRVPDAVLAEYPGLRKGKAEQEQEAQPEPTAKPTQKFYPPMSDEEYKAEEARRTTAEDRKKRIDYLDHERRKHIYETIKNDPETDTSQSLGARIGSAYLKLTQGQFNSRVRLADLREMLPGVSKEDLDKELLRLQTAKHLAIYRNGDPMDLKQRDHDAALYLPGSGERRDLFYMRSIPAESQPVRSTPTATSTQKRPVKPSLDTLSYGDLQKRARDLGIKAGGKRDALEARIREAEAPRRLEDIVDDEERRRYREGLARESEKSPKARPKQGGDESLSETRAAVSMGGDVVPEEIEGMADAFGELAPEPAAPGPEVQTKEEAESEKKYPTWEPEWVLWQERQVLRVPGSRYLARPWGGMPPKGYRIYDTKTKKIVTELNPKETRSWLSNAARSEEELPPTGYWQDKPRAEREAESQKHQRSRQKRKESAKQKRKQESVAEPLGSSDDEKLVEIRERVKSGKPLRFNDDRKLARLEAEAKANPDKWEIGMGVGYRLGYPAKYTSQINRGFRIIDVDPENKMALVRSIADTGITVTGGDYDKISDQWIHIAALIRDKKYDKQQAPSGNAMAEAQPGAGGRPGEPYRPMDNNEANPRLADLLVQELPEMVQFATEGAGGKAPKIYKKLKGGILGFFKAVEGKPAESSIGLSADIFIGPKVASETQKEKPSKDLMAKFHTRVAQEQGLEEDDVYTDYDYDRKTRKYELRGFKIDPRYAGRALGHEVGHGIFDYLPEGTLKRGNIFGRIASLKKYMKHSLGNLTPQDFKDITKELKDLSMWWRPWNPESADAKMKRYRNSSKELYADAMSVLLNNPEALQHRAPKFTEAFLNYLERKPKVHDLYRDIWNQIKKGRVGDSRLDRLFAMVERGVDKRNIMSLAKVRVPSVKEAYLWLKGGLWEEAAYEMDLERKAKKEGKPVDPEKSPRYWTEQVAYMSSVHAAYMRDTYHMRQELEAQGVTDAALGIYLGLRRAAGERKYMASPLGIGGELAEQTIQKLRQRLGETKFNIVVETAKKYWKIRQKHPIAISEEAEMWTDDVMEKIKTNEEYVTYALQRFIDDTYGPGVSPQIYKQVGTLDDIENPFTATVMKDLAIMRAAILNSAKKNLIEFVKELDPNQENEMWVEAEKYWDPRSQSQKFLPPKDQEKHGLLMYSDKGELKGFYIDKHLVDFYDKDPIRAHHIMKVWTGTMSLFRGAYTTYNPGFAAWNFQRDIRGLYKKMPGGVFTGKKIAVAIRDSWRDAFMDAFLNQSSQIVEEMYMEGTLIAGRQYSAFEQGWKSQVEQIEASFAYRDSERKDLKHLNNWYGFKQVDQFNQMIERIPKIAGYRYLKENQAELKLSQAQINHLVRTRAGSPDFLRGGRWRLLTNNIWLFSNASWQGWRGDLEAFREDPASYAIKTVMVDLIPTLMKYGALHGVGDAVVSAMLGWDDDDTPIKDAMEKVNLYDYYSKMVIPLWIFGDEAAYLPFPQDYVGQLTSELLLRILDAKGTPAPTEVLATVAGGLPIQPTNLSPPLTIAADLFRFATGTNPMNGFTGGPAINPTVFQNGGLRSLGHFLAYEWNDNMGMLYKFPTGLQKDQGPIEDFLDMPIVGSTLSRFVRASNSGVEQRLKRALEPEAKKEGLVTQGITDAVVAEVAKLEKGASQTEIEEAMFRAHNNALEKGLITPGDPYTAGRFQARFSKAVMFRIGEPEDKATLYGSKAEKTFVENLMREEEGLPPIKADKDGNFMDELKRLGRGRPVERARLNNYKMTQTTVQKWIQDGHYTRGQALKMYWAYLMKEYKTPATRMKYYRRLIAALPKQESARE